MKDAGGRSGRDNPRAEDREEISEALDGQPAHQETREERAERERRDRITRRLAEIAKEKGLNPELTWTEEDYEP